MVGTKHGERLSRRFPIVIFVAIIAAICAMLALRSISPAQDHETLSPLTFGTPGSSPDQPESSNAEQADDLTPTPISGQQGKATTRNQKTRTAAQSFRKFHIDVPGAKPDRRHRISSNHTPSAAAQERQKKDDLEMPEWEQIITPEGASIDRMAAKGRQGPNGIPDYLEIYSGFEAGYVEEVISNGIATDWSALLIERDVSREVLFNGEVRPEHDLGNTLYLLSISPGGNFRIYVGVERLQSDLPTFIEFEFNQDLMRIGSGIPWWEVQGTRRDGDLLVRFNLMAGTLTSVELAQWQHNRYLVFESDTDGLGIGCRDKFSYIYCMGAPPLDRSNQYIEVWDSEFVPVEPTLANSFAELGIDLDRMALSATEFRGVYIRTPEDVVLASFRAFGNPAFGSP